MRAIWLVCLGLMGCASLAQSDAPALLVAPDAAARNEVQRAVTSALQRSDVTLAEDALTRDSLLIIERTAARDPTGQRLSGRDYDRPEQFQLVASNGRCALIHQRTGSRHELPSARCVAAR
jgi:hypothetical protein